jgi:hypothetical protein
MKAIKMRMQKSSRWLVILLGTAVVIITSIVVANATQTITTPNAAFISYSLAAGANSAAITPAASRTVSVMGCCTTASPIDQGVGQVSLLHIPSGGMVWVGLNSFSNVTLVGGHSSAPGTHIVYIDSGQSVDIQVASADTIRVHNGAGITLAGNVTLIW